MPSKEKVVYLTFDDGPHPVATPWVLDQLKQYNAKATFFCIGNNVLQHNQIYQQIRAEGHAVGNHTFHHLNGWKTPAATYLADVTAAGKVIESKLFRPPFGKITAGQARGLKAALKEEKTKVIMWDVLSADYDARLLPEECTKNVLKNTGAGSIIVFHDSEKAFPNLKYTLPAVLKYLQNDGYRFEEILMDGL
jgi:peptidoglycan/xylan/chitin deacetylase (PgdA/CDA1 family)